MPFLAATTFLLYAHMIATFRALSNRDGPQRITAVLHWLAATVGACAVIFGFGLEAVFTGAQRPGTNLSVPLFFALGVLTVIVFGKKLLAARHQAAEGPAFRVGMIVWAVLAGIYLTGTTIDHWVFFSDRDKSGIGDARALGVDDVQCDGISLVRIDSETARYRCPTSLVWGGVLLEWPFAPWPSYQAGESEKLKRGIEALHRNAVPVR
ncbi:MULTISPECIES: hypothetical protein [Cupriavidus]|uniref:hypothetical protein n=1 Tax=Cupriavidus TaxID=106589 RepID=UPI0011EC8FBB|nr:MULTISPECIES: hypothetical protein [Cupriavidus]MWL91775.1 hypothetical protein [Cupriavidus sp. SW-Y-13]